MNVRRVRFALADLPDNIEKFGFILGLQKRTFKDQDPVNIQAAERVGLLHDALAASGYTGHDLEQFLVRIVFCFFADDTGIFEPRDIFLDLLENRTNGKMARIWAGGWRNCSRCSTHPKTDAPKRSTKTSTASPMSTETSSATRCPYHRSIPGCASGSSTLAISIGPISLRPSSARYSSPSWRRTNAARQGAHYTTEQNILKVIEPLFLDDLRVEFQRLKARRDVRRIPELIAFQQRLGNLRFFDPACGCGNFLIIAYRELRAVGDRGSQGDSPEGARSTPLQNCFRW